MPNPEFRVRFSISPTINGRLSFWARETGEKESALARRGLLMLLDQLDASRGHWDGAAPQESGEDLPPAVREPVRMARQTTPPVPTR